MFQSVQPVHPVFVVLPGMFFLLLLQTVKEKTRIFLIALILMLVIVCNSIYEKLQTHSIRNQHIHLNQQPRVTFSHLYGLNGKKRFFFGIKYLSFLKFKLLIQCICFFFLCHMGEIHCFYAVPVPGFICVHNPLSGYSQTKGRLTPYHAVYRLFQPVNLP